MARGIIRKRKANWNGHILGTDRLQKINNTKKDCREEGNMKKICGMLMD